MSEVLMTQIVATTVLLILFFAVVLPAFKYKGLILANLTGFAVLLFLYIPISRMEITTAILSVLFAIAIVSLIYLAIEFMIDQEPSKTVKRLPYKIVTTIFVLASTILIFIAF